MKKNKSKRKHTFSFDIECTKLIPQVRQMKEPPFKVRVNDDNGNFVGEFTVNDMRDLYGSCEVPSCLEGKTYTNIIDPECKGLLDENIFGVRDSEESIPDFSKTDRLEDIHNQYKKC